MVTELLFLTQLYLLFINANHFFNVDANKYELRMECARKCGKPCTAQAVLTKLH